MAIPFKLIVVLFVAVCTTCCRQPVPTPAIETAAPVVVNDTPLPPQPEAPQKASFEKKPVPVTLVPVEELPIEKVGKLLLKDSLPTLENEVIIYKLLDSLCAKTRKSRDFYFLVFNKLIKRSDGILADAVGDYALNYVETYPAEFLANSKAFSNALLETWASQIGIELYLSAGSTKDSFDKTVETFRRNCKGCSTTEMERLARFEGLIWNTIKQNLDERVP